MAVEEDGGEDEADEEQDEQDDQTRPRNDVTATRMTSDNMTTADLSQHDVTHRKRRRFLSGFTTYRGSLGSFLSRIVYILYSFDIETKLLREILH